MGNFELNNAKNYEQNTSTLVHTIIYWLIAMATITFHKQNIAATKQGQLLYERGHLTFVEYPNNGIYMVQMFQI